MLAWVALDSDTRQLHQDLKGNVFALPYDARAECRVWAEIHLAEAVAFEFECTHHCHIVTMLGLTPSRNTSGWYFSIYIISTES
jgi:hypothetical protein